MASIARNVWSENNNISFHCFPSHAQTTHDLFLTLAHQSLTALTTPQLPQDWILATAVDTAAGLKYLHDPPRRFVHRDLSAGNILLKSKADLGADAGDPGPDGRPFYSVISDFGA